MGVKLALLNNLEHEELLGGLRSVPARVLPALLTPVLLHLAGDMTGAWALSWLALVPLCFACRGAGPFGALLLAGVSFSLAAVFQSFWLLDVDGVSPLLVWLAAGLLPALPFFALELPICRKIPWPLRPLLMVLLASAFWALLPHDARMLIPTGGMIDSRLVRFIYPRVGLASLAGVMTGFAWMAAEMFATPRLREPRRSGWPGLLVTGLLLIACCGDWVGSYATVPINRRDFVRFYVVTAEDNLVGATDSALTGKTEGAIVVWRPVVVKDAAERLDWVARAGDLAQRRHIGLVLVIAGPDSTSAYMFDRGPVPAVQKSWPGRPGEVAGEPLVAENMWQLRVYPSMTTLNHWSTQWSTEIYTMPFEPVHPAQERYWIREQRREALIRGSRQITVWPGGGVGVDGLGEVLQRSEGGSSFMVLLPAAQQMGEPLGRPRQKYLEGILKLSGPVLVLMLMLLTPVAWAKRRYYARRQSSLMVAIEELPDEQTTLTKEETERITKSYKRET